MRSPNGAVVQWVPEITHHCPQAAFILVGTKGDLRNDPNTLASLAQRGVQPVPREAAEALAKELGAVAYCENSALTQVGLKCVFFEVSPGRSVRLTQRRETFDKAIRTGLGHKKPLEPPLPPAPARPSVLPPQGTLLKGTPPSVACV